MNAKMAAEVSTLANTYVKNLSFLWKILVAILEVWHVATIWWMASWGVPKGTLSYLLKLLSIFLGFELKWFYNLFDMFGGFSNFKRFTTVSFKYLPLMFEGPHLTAFLWRGFAYLFLKCSQHLEGY